MYFESQSDCYYLKHGVKFITICPGMTTTPLVEQALSIQGGIMSESEDYVKKFIASAPSQTYLSWEKREEHEINNYFYSRADQCGKNIVMITAAPRNGAILILDGGIVKEVTIPEYWQPTSAQ